MVNNIPKVYLSISEAANADLMVAIEKGFDYTYKNKLSRSFYRGTPLSYKDMDIIVIIPPSGCYISANRYSVGAGQYAFIDKWLSKIPIYLVVSTGINGSNIKVKRIQETIRTDVDAKNNWGHIIIDPENCLLEEVLEEWKKLDPSNNPCTEVAFIPYGVDPILPQEAVPMLATIVFLRT